MSLRMNWSSSTIRTACVTPGLSNQLLSPDLGSDTVERFVVDGLEGLDDLGVKLLAGLGADHLARCGDGGGLTVRALRGEGVEHVGHGENARRQRYVLTGQPVRISLPI